MRWNRLTAYLLLVVFLLVGAGCASPTNNELNDEISAAKSVNQVEKDPIKLSDEEIKMTINKAELAVHSVFAEIYLNKLEGIERPVFSSLRPNLENYFTEKALMNNLQGFYDDEQVFMEWGYIMGEVFPFISLEALDNMEVLENQEEAVLVNIIITEKQGLGFTMETKIALIKEQGKWLVEYR